MTTNKFFVSRHPEFQDRISNEIRESDETDFDQIIEIIPYASRKPAGSDEFIKYDHSLVDDAFDGEVPNVILDIVEIAVATFAADKAVSRDIDIQDDVDDSRLETRNIKLQISVLSAEMATTEMEELYSEMVSHMTRDIIEYDLQKVETQREIQTSTTHSENEAISLLSDGLDSTGGIYYNLSRGIESDHVTVNYGHGIGSKAEKIADEIGVTHQTYRTKYTGRGESTQFSRGLLHLSFAVAAASAQDITKVQCFENGIMARFLILSDGWMTTRTVSPLFLTYFNKILELALDKPIQVENPFENRTKTEIVNEIEDTEIIPKTVSCPHTARFGGENCGFCVPCIIRNTGIIASEHKIPIKNLSKYDPLLDSDFANQDFNKEVTEITNTSANTPEIFFKGITEIAYFCRRILEETPRELADEYPDLLSKPIYEQHHTFAENFTQALSTAYEQNESIRHLLPAKPIDNR
ncbi:hypothetical protein C454_11166 [Haloferax gibbonsii ATCC 33959]|uniref:7-cyano-7-deazaguanine synthase n=1 Tax=Haloferax gibbonsii (strain ATCC 33959 / DSM 4427 / JCM 8863 / NBRC 102184 / NCIMB 2188 / Ma 2.38) TaxID=1227459 RepID=M0H8V3_HALGM|nr:7-cyano-7-deazaguanine synthase [Haloferax gibbonsii]ELZ80167.1 hypothetical protein C454_11166 [Haloferax gibbonsii ATCC 33959]